MSPPARPEVAVRPRGEHVRPRGDQAVSYLDDGRQVVCTFPGGPPAAGRRWVCDAERFDRRPREHVVRAWGLPDGRFAFARAWTRLEVAAKAEDVPVVLRGRGPGAALPVRSMTLPGERIVVSWALGARPVAGAGGPSCGSW
ncbi:hypothetical protein [Kineococcus sp. SYSU DK018]|uniref:hypothetical protein n=1 Tax=Kineococcus sp. SYSU DK018 TaxID=3383139 RepID=UPI003D7EB6C8